MEGIIRLLALSHYLCLKQVSEDKFMENEEIEKLKGNLPFIKYDKLHKLLYEKLGFEYNSKDFIPKFDLIKKVSLLEFTYTNTVLENKIAKKVEEYYGDDAFLLYISVMMFLNLFGIVSTAEHMLKYPKGKIKTRGEILRLRKLEKETIKYFKDSCWILDDTEYLLKYYPLELIKKIGELNNTIKGKDLDLNLLQLLHKKMSPLIPEIVPEYKELLTKEEKAINLINELNQIKPGKGDWVKYEKYCIKVLNYLFVPEFRKVHVQVKNHDGYERRDAIIPNNSFSRFWIDIKNEFQSKNIVFEFKNLSKDYSKNELNQLRIYLSKPTIGKFGILIVRKKDEKRNLIQAQRDAYEQSGILILIVDDLLLENLILSKAYFNSCDDILSNEKIKFEINY